jgi:hypothetical protein
MSSVAATNIPNQTRKPAQMNADTTPHGFGFPDVLDGCNASAPIAAAQQTYKPTTRPKRGNARRKVSRYDFKMSRSFAVRATGNAAPQDKTVTNFMQVNISGHLTRREPWGDTPGRQVATPPDKAVCRLLSGIVPDNTVMYPVEGEAIAYAGWTEGCRQR